MQNNKAEQLRDTSFLAGIMLSFGMAALYQLDFEVTQYPGVLDILYALTVALTVRLLPVQFSSGIAKNVLLVSSLIILVL